jgi:hypothetical protein
MTTPTRCAPRALRPVILSAFLQTRIMGWEEPDASIDAPDSVTHVVGREDRALCGAWLCSFGPVWPGVRRGWPAGVRRCARCERSLFADLRY